jgi:hypothetical protein
VQARKPVIYLLLIGWLKNHIEAQMFIDYIVLMRAVALLISKENERR